MKLTCTIRATVPNIIATVVRSLLASYTPGVLRAMVQERTPAGITIDSVTVEEDKTP